jgi:DNA-binding CsgD family transcriptional regulator
MRHRFNSELGERIEHSKFRPMLKVFDEITHTQNIQNIAATIGSICGTLLPCDEGGVGVFDKQAQRITLWIPVGDYGDRTMGSYDRIHDHCTIGVELVNHWVELQQFLFLEIMDGLCACQSHSATSVPPEAKNVILDGVCKGGDDRFCFYSLANVDKAELPKYQVIMNLILSSLSNGLLRLAGGNGTLPKNGESLTDREREIIAHIHNGLSNKVIAGRLHISINTVKSHIYHIFQKLHATNRVEALVKAKQGGYL